MEEQTPLNCLALTWSTSTPTLAMGSLRMFSAGRSAVGQEGQKFGSNIHFFFSGLRCHTSEACHFWRWTDPQADFSNLEMKCEDQKGGECKHRRCEMFARGKPSWCKQPGTGSLTKGTSSSSDDKTIHRSYVSGDKKCYEQVLGAFNGCYRENLSYRGDKLQLLQTYGITEPKPKPENWSFGRFRNWGECASKCKNNSMCKHWTWSSTSCADCFPLTCALFGERKEKDNIYDPILSDHRGHISGHVECQDITYVESNDRSKVFDSLEIGNNLEFSIGPCQSTKGGTPLCPAQAVPGYK